MSTALKALALIICPVAGATVESQYHPVSKVIKHIKPHTKAPVVKHKPIQIVEPKRENYCDQLTIISEPIISNPYEFNGFGDESNIHVFSDNYGSITPQKDQTKNYWPIIPEKEKGIQPVIQSGVPEPASWIFMSMGIGTIGYVLRYKKKAALN